jgi:hypothetical protein
MIDPRDILKALFETFDMSARADFQNFLMRNAGITKWMISSDYALHDPNRPNHVFAFSVLPYNDHFDALKQEINAALPKDLKKTSVISDEACQLLCDPSRYHFAFVLKAPPKVFNNGDKSKSIDIARKSIDCTIKEMCATGGPKESIEILQGLRRAAAANGFNVKLLSDIFMLSHLYSFVTLALARDNAANIIGWMSDRDKMTEAYDGALWVIANENVRGLAAHFDVAIPEGSPYISLPTPVEPANAEHADGDGGHPGKPAPVKSIMWFDEFIRLPDYLAGVLAAWDFSVNGLPLGQPKYLNLAQKVIASAENMAVITVRYTHEFQSGRMVFDRVDQSVGTEPQEAAVSSKVS